MPVKDGDGFTLVEVIIAIAVFVVIIPAIVGMLVSVGYINNRSNAYGIIGGVAESKLESLRSKGYANLSNGMTDFSNELPDQLGTPHSASYTISHQSTTIKKIVLTISYTTQGETLSHSYTSYVGQHGLGQQ